eukprot:366258-Chlamydomonas_euryale.AAC.9
MTTIIAELGYEEMLMSRDEAYAVERGQDLCLWGFLNHAAALLLHPDTEQQGSVFHGPLQ